ncbi:hypothetical protein GGI23_007797 [Coemansia sp. RSA 2559]|nr:hypothetical protein GGI23_007797 [Coemansia sp. RSA 2559]
MSPNNMTMHSPLTYGSFNDSISGTPGSFTSMQSDFSDASQSHVGFNHVPVTPTKTSSSVDTVGMLGSGFLGLQVDDPPMNHASMHQATSFGQMHSQQHPSMSVSNHGPPMDYFSLTNHLGSSDGDLQPDANNQRKKTDDSSDSIPLLERSAMEQQFDCYPDTDNRSNNVNGGGGISDEILDYYFSTTQHQQQQQQHQQQAVGNSVCSGSGGIVPGLTLYQHASGSPPATNTAMAGDFGNGDITKR